MGLARENVAKKTERGDGEGRFSLSNFSSFVDAASAHLCRCPNMPGVARIDHDTRPRPKRRSSHGFAQSAPAADPALTALVAKATERVARSRSTGGGVVDSAQAEEKSYNPRSVPPLSPLSLSSKTPSSCRPMTSAMRWDYSRRIRGPCSSRSPTGAWMCASCLPQGTRTASWNLHEREGP